MYQKHDDEEEAAAEAEKHDKIIKRPNIEYVRVGENHCTASVHSLHNSFDFVSPKTHSRYIQMVNNCKFSSPQSYFFFCRQRI